MKNQQEKINKLEAELQSALAKYKQLAEFVSEIHTIGLTKEQYSHLQATMAWERTEIDELLKFADNEWEKELNKIRDGN